MDFLGLKDKTVLVTGVANRRSVAYHIGQRLAEAGARPIYVVRSTERQAAVAKLFPDAEIYTCDVEFPTQIEALAQAIADRGHKLQGLVHSIAFADYEGEVKPFHETGKQQFLRAVDISCFSL